MGKYEQRLENDLKQIRKKLAELSAQVETGIKNSIEALLTNDKPLAYQTVLADNPINRGFEDINKLCHAFVARHLPSAGHLRRISAILRFNLEMERIGDYASTISREAVSLTQPLNKSMARHLETLTGDARHILKQSITAFIDDNEELAKATIASARSANTMFDNAFNDLSDENNRGDWSLAELYGMLAVYASLSRVISQSKNICEETVFIVTGETKKRRPVKILFVDEDNQLSMMAEAISQKAFPDCTRCSSVSVSPANSLDSDYLEFMDRCGFDMSEIEPKAFSSILKLDEFDVIISLQKPIESFLPKLPFHTIGLDWNIEQENNSDANQKKQFMEEAYDKISEQMHDLMKIMRGKEAA